jgi:hypothetical protein
MSTVRKEILSQAEAFRRMNGNALELIQAYAEDFRQIIVEYENSHNGEPPSASDLIWIISERLGRDITRL